MKELEETKNKYLKKKKQLERYERLHKAKKHIQDTVKKQNEPCNSNTFNKSKPEGNQFLLMMNFNSS